LVKGKEDYILEYLESATTLRIKLDTLEQAIVKIAEMAWAVDSYPVEPGDRPVDEPSKEET
jgi:hypothetical protein